MQLLDFSSAKSLVLRLMRRTYAVSLSALTVTFLAALTVWQTTAYGQAPKEYDIKAVFLYNFTQFIEWPEHTFASDTDSFIIAVVGDDPFKDALNNTVRNESVNGHPMKVVRYKSVEEIQFSHILYVSRSESSNLERLLTSLDFTGALTVSDMDAFPEKGGMIGFHTEDNRIRLKINVEEARKSQLNISSKLLRLADIVETEEE